MKQVFFDGSGQLLVRDVPSPALSSGQVLVRVSHSLISAGTESTTATGQGSVIRRIIQQPYLIGNALKLAREQGLMTMLRTAQEVTTTWVPTGYSAAGTVVAVGESITTVRVGDRVACAGAGWANHAEFIAVPENLTVPVPEGLSLREASFATLGAIALQGVRRAEPTLGETVLVVGTGLIGLLTVQLLRANGCRVLASDLSPERLALAKQLGATATFDPSQGSMKAGIEALTAGAGVDAVIITAGTNSSEPVNQAFRLTRERGRIVLVGAVGMDLERPDFYRKEIDLRMSRSYGPGRHDPDYEEKGVAYPLGYVRWTEQRNLATFLDMVADGRVDVTRLTTHDYAVDDAPVAYGTVLNGGPSVIGVTLNYPGAPGAPQATLRLRERGEQRAGTVGIALVGTGSFAQYMHIPNLKALKDRVTVPVVVSGSGGKARQTAEALKAELATTSLGDALASKVVDAVLLSTRHHLHAEQCLAAIDAGKHVFVEKPLSLSVADSRRIEQAVAETGLLLTVGFNRRFAPLAQALFTAVQQVAGPKQIIFRVNAGPLPPTHWLRDREIGGGRVVGEGCHFFDFVTWLAASAPVAVTAQFLGDDRDELSAAIKYADGSLGTVVYSGQGHAHAPKERVEVMAGGGFAALDDFTGLSLTGLPGKSQTLRRQDKGHLALLSNFVDAVRGEAALGITASDGRLADELAHAALQAAQTGETVAIGAAS